MKKTTLFIILTFILFVGLSYAAPPAPTPNPRLSTDCSTSAYWALNVQCVNTLTGKMYRGTGTGVVEVISAIAGAGPTFDIVGAGTNVTAAMVVGAGASLTYSTTGTINASGYKGNSTPTAAMFGFLDPTSSIQGQLNGKASSTAATTVNGQTCTLGSTCTVTASLPSDPSGCPGGQYVSDIAANGTLSCGTPAGSGVISDTAAAGDTTHTWSADKLLTVMPAYTPPGTNIPICRTGATTLGGCTNVTDIAIPIASTTTPSMDGSATYGSATTWARSDHVHPSDTTKQNTITTNNAIPATLTESGTGTTLTGPREYYYCTGTCTITLPNGPAAGTAYEFCAINVPGVSTAITFSAATNRYYGKPDGSAYGTVTSGTLSCTAAAGNKLCVTSLDATHYVTTSYAGTCTAN